MTDRGILVLQDCEERLRELVSEAAACGKYDAVVRLTEWARIIAALASGTPLPGSEAAIHTVAGNGASAAEPNRSVTGSVRRDRGVRKGQRKKKSRRAAYPRFARLKNELVKIGWSKKAKKEYQHKATRQIVDILVERLHQVGATGELFTTEELFPLQDESHSDIPAYQAYLCLAWLRNQNLVEQVGRQGYRLIERAGLKETVAHRWDELALFRQ